MKYEAIFNRLNGSILPHAGKPSSEVLQVVRNQAFRLGKEIREQGDRASTKFGIRVAKVLESGRFIKVELCHLVCGDTWQTRAIGYLDTRGEKLPATVYRYLTLGGDKQQVISTPGHPDSAIRNLLSRHIEEWEHEPLPT